MRPEPDNAHLDPIGAPDGDVITKFSPWSVSETVERLLAVAAAKELKALVWADDDDRTRLSYVAPEALAGRYGLTAELVARLAGIDGLTNAVIAR
jgi:hypothetical protein